MKKCLGCDATFPSSDVICPICHYQPQMQGGVILYAPALAREGGGFREEYFEELFRLEAGYFWFQARNRLINYALNKYAADFQSFLEIGCGTGYVLSGIAAEHPNASLQGAELFTAGLRFSAIRQPKVRFMQMDARKIPFADEFDTIGAFDVLEHIEEDEKVLQQIHNALKPCGIMLLTVPQHPWLWSKVDDYACHVRRYSAKELHAKVERSGFKILRSTSFVFSLLPAMWLSRFARGGENEIDPVAEFRISSWLNKLLELVMRAELFMIRMGINLPLGGSRLLVARRD